MSVIALAAKSRKLNKILLHKYCFLAFEANDPFQPFRNLVELGNVEKITTGNSEHYNWGNNCDGWHLLKTNSLSVIREKMPAGTMEKLHYHSSAQQLFYILAGEATFKLNDSEIVVCPGESLFVPPGAVHNIRNSSPGDLEFLVISQPPAQGDRQDIV